MKFLLDENIPKELGNFLKNKGFKIELINSNKHKGKSDKEVFEYAVKNMAIFKTSSKKEYAFFLLYFLKSDEMGKILNENMAGSTQSYITLSVLRSIPIVIPSDQDICVFSKSVETIVKAIIFKDRENQTLTQMQTLLLSKMGKQD